MTAPMKEISQFELNSMLLNLQQVFTIKTILSVEDSTNDYCNLGFEFDEKQRNIQAGDEYLISSNFNIILSDPAFSIFNYYILLRYYKLDSDMDEEDVPVLLEKEFPLTLGDNVISFDDYPVYLQSEFDLLIRKGDD